MHIFELTDHQRKVLELEEWIASVNAECLNQPVRTPVQVREAYYARLAIEADAYLLEQFRTPFVFEPEVRGPRERMDMLRQIMSEEWAGSQIRKRNSDLFRFDGITEA